MSQELYVSDLLTEEPWGVARIAYTRKWGFRDGDGVMQPETFLTFKGACAARDRMRDKELSGSDFMYEIVKASRDCPLYKTLVKMRKGDYISLKPEDLQKLGEEGLKQALLSAEDYSGYSFESRYRTDTLELWCV